MYEALGSREGIANATVQLGETCRRRGWLEDAKGWYRQAVDAAAGLPVALTNAWDGLGEAHLADGDREAAVAAHTTALSTAGPNYPRGRAHAIHGLARCAANAKTWRSAIPHYTDAAELYREINDLTSAASAESGLARCYEELGDIKQGLRHRLAAVGHVETARASQAAHAQQGEYFARFSTAHEMALRAAVMAGDPAAFVAVFESIAGRRLAGLIANIPEGFYGPQGLGRLVLEAESPVNRRRLLTRTLNDVGLRRDATGTRRDEFDESLAGLYTPFDPNHVDELWTRVETGEAYVLLVVVLHKLEALAWFLRPPQAGLVHIGLTDLSNTVTELVGSLHSAGLPLDALPNDVAALSALMPNEALELVERDVPLVIVPAGQLWAVPWTAVPVSVSEYLGERNPLSVAPSLTAVAHSCGGLRDPAGPTTAHWRSPLVSQHRLNVYAGRAGSTRALTTAADCRSAILHAEHDLVVVLSHGRPVGDLMHCLELDEHVALTPADLMRAEPPPALALIACWGAHSPGQGWGDPLSIATLALARNSRRIAATVSELLDDAASSRFVNMFLDYAQAQPMPQALQRATQRWMSHPGYRNGYLSRWAPLVVVGTW
ncbi:hypothetical protein MARA_00160 (plasmid) [Mycolicibacterium arabiense]|uniref:CHAT domain-containing protein n=3 Tax=Mycolicibacterium arabiense TaxID=1286181 RepID=A0A7I7RRA4_9MYCO|nr:hypothetical protein MARA_00160 [Mycolicibacterium arabiense]